MTVSIPIPLFSFSAELLLKVPFNKKIAANSMKNATNIAPAMKIPLSPPIRYPTVTIVKEDTAIIASILLAV